MVKIHSDQSVEAFSREQSKGKAQTVTGQAFGDLLSQEVSKGGTKAAAPPPPGGLFAVNPLIGVSSTSSVDSSTAGTDEIAQSVEKVLDACESYANQIGTAQGGDSLKTAYASLESATAQASALKEKYQAQAESDPKLKEIFQNLDTVLATERFKFNRGDYL